VFFVAVFSAFCLILSPREAAPQTALENLLSPMQAGEFKELPTNGLRDSFLRIPPGSILQFAESAAWDPVTRKIFFMGKASAPGDSVRFINYSVADNTWRREPQPICQSDCFGHAYDHQVINQATGDYYIRWYGAQKIHQYKTTTATWNPRTIDLPPSIPNICCVGMAYFPERNGIVFAWGGRVYFYGVGTGKWDDLGRRPMGPLHNIAEYSPVHKIVIFGGGNGSKDLYRMDVNGTITKMKDAPGNIGIIASGIAADPSTGDYLVFMRNSATAIVDYFYRYDPIGDIWRLQSKANNPIIGADGGTGFISAPLPEYGAVFYLVHFLGAPKVFIYKTGS
jgi:hypothetical protein